MNAIWFNPWYPSPLADGGYDVSDYCDIHPACGTLDQARKLIIEAQELGLRVILDIVPNRTSDQHPWFQEALTSAPASPDRERFILREGRRADGSEPPIDWLVAFGGPAWTRTPDGQWYLHVRTWRAIADSYPDPRVFVAEAHVRPGHLADHLRPGELHTAFNFDFLKCALEADRLKEVIDRPITDLAKAGAPATCVLSNHDETATSPATATLTPASCLRRLTRVTPPTSRRRRCGVRGRCGGGCRSGLQT